MISYSIFKKIHEKMKFMFMCIVFFSIMLMSATALSWSRGSRVHAVVLRGSSMSIESGRITALDGGMSRVRWDRCNCETLVPVKHLHRSRSAALTAGADQDTAGMSLNDSAESAGKMGLLYLLLGRSVEK